MNWFDGFESIVREHAPLAPFTWFKLGGAARWLVQPRDERELSLAMARCHAEGIETRFLGKGANLLVDDGGVDAAVFRLTGPLFESVRREENPSTIMTAFAGADLMALVKATSREGLSGLHVLAGIPATMGGAVRMNCGGKYGEIAPVIRCVRVIQPDGTIRDRRDVKFKYRGNDLGNERVVAATIELAPTDPEATYAEYLRIWNEKMASQPSLGQRSAGCIFKNPGVMRDGKPLGAGKIIDECGLKGTRVGGAVVSAVHANFIVAEANATAADVLRLIELICGRVADYSGIELKTEVEFWSARTLAMAG